VYQVALLLLSCELGSTLFKITKYRFIRLSNHSANLKLRLPRGNTLSGTLKGLEGSIPSASFQRLVLSASRQAHPGPSRLSVSFVGISLCASKKTGAASLSSDKWSPLSLHPFDCVASGI
jgi:hypothetical protein